MLRQLTLAAGLAFLNAGCAVWERAFAAAPNPWPVTTDGKVRREGRLLRVYGSSLHDRIGADVDARRALEAWLRSLAFGDDPAERQAVIDGVLISDDAAPLPSPMPELVGFSSIIELDLAGLQKKLGTHYE